MDVFTVAKVDVMEGPFSSPSRTAEEQGNVKYVCVPLFFLFSLSVELSQRISELSFLWKKKTHYQRTVAVVVTAG